MNEKDLRIGNHVTDEFYSSFNTIITVDDLNEYGINLLIEDDGKLPELAEHTIEPSYKYDELYGIPLTEEILLKGGFEKIKDQEVYKVGEYLLRKYCNNMLFFTALKFGNFSLAEIEHLHQLQNLYFALTNKELEIKL